MCASIHLKLPQIWDSRGLNDNWFLHFSKMMHNRVKSPIQIELQTYNIDHIQRLLHFGANHDRYFFMTKVLVYLRLKS